MPEFSLPAAAQAPLADVVLEPGVPGEHKGVEDEPVLKTVRGKQNRIQIGVPQTTDVLRHWPGSERLEPEISSGQLTSDFYSVRLAFTFLPDKGCRFMWARVIATFTVGDVPDDGRAAASPVVVDMFPRDVLADSRTFKRAFSIGPSMKFGFAELSGTGSFEEEVVRYEPRLTPGGLLSDAPNWTFESRERAGIIGNKELFIIVKKAKAHELRVRFSLAAEVATYAGRIPLRRYRDPSPLARTYPVHPSPAS